jgi:hypothetical protein
MIISLSSSRLLFHYGTLPVSLMPNSGHVSAQVDLNVLGSSRVIVNVIVIGIGFVPGAALTFPKADIVLSAVMAASIVA